MVAYSFKGQFAEPIASKAKRQTVRGPRSRHARPGEPVQLYAGMRTKYCRKLLTPDPVCIDVRPISIMIDSCNPHIIAGIAIDGADLDDAAIEAFAVADGFGAALADGFARRRMGEFWCQNHEWNRFHGVVIRWEPQ